MGTAAWSASSKSAGEPWQRPPHGSESAGGAHEASVTPLGPRLDGAPAPSSGPSSPARPRDLREAATRLTGRRRAAVDGPDPEATIRRRAQGKLTARERIGLLLDADSFVELDTFARHGATGFGMERRRPDTDGVVTGWGTVDGKRVCVFAHDPRIFGGALGRSLRRRWPPCDLRRGRH
jgi:hypothetical protein